MPKQLPQTGVQNTGEPVYLVDPSTGTPTGGSGTTASQVQGNVAAGATDSGNPVKVGGLVNTGLPGNTATGQRVDWWMGRTGSGATFLTVQDGTIVQAAGTQSDAQNNVTGIALNVRNFGLVYSGDNFWQRQRGDTNGTNMQRSLSTAIWNFASATGGLTTTADTVMIAAGGAGVRNYCAGISFANSAATASEIVVKDGASTVLWRGYVGASQTTTQFVTFDVPLKGSANTDMIVAMITTATATRVSAQGFQGS